MAPLQQTLPSREFTLAMYALTAYRLRLNPTLPKILMTLTFNVWPRLVEHAFAQRPAFKQAGMQAFNLALLCSNPYGVMGAVLACYMAHQVTPLLPPVLHHSMRTAGFLGGMVGGPQCAARLLRIANS